MAKELAKKSADTCYRVRMSYLYTRQEFADLIDEKKSAVYLWEKGLRTPRMPTIRKYMALAKKKKIPLKIEDFGRVE